MTYHAPPPFARWLVLTPLKVDGKRFHHFPTRAQQRAFAAAHHGWCFEIVRSKH